MRPKAHSWVLIQHFIIQQQPSGRKVFCFQLGAMRSPCLRGPDIHFFTLSEVRLQFS